MASHHHEMCRSKICLVCRGCASCCIEQHSNLHRFIQDFVIGDYSPEDQRLPRALCKSCRDKLFQFGQGNFSPILPEIESYEEMRNFRSPRSSTDRLCSCQICSLYKVSTRFGYRKGLKKRVVSLGKRY